MPSRRSFLAGLAALPLLGRRARAEARLGDDGLYHQPWFLESFLELADDLEGAAAKGKRFAVLWELKGCPFCRQLHLLDFGDPQIEAFVKERFEVLQLNFVGAREVTDFDGEKLSEKDLAEKYGIFSAPTVQFFPERAAGLAERKPQDREVSRLRGYRPPKEFRAHFAFVAERAYETRSLKDYLAAQD